MSKGKVYLIPNLLGPEANVLASLPAENISIIQSINHFAVENIRDSRRFLVKIGLKPKIDESEFFELNKRSNSKSLSPILSILKEGQSVGIISDAGCPGIADPGALLVELAHKNHIRVVPLVGPSSILLALIGSGFNGQSFAFNGYLNREPTIRNKEIKMLESKVQNQHQTQLFMETPYRNESLWEHLLKTLLPTTLLCLAMNLSLPNEFIQTKSIADWRKSGKKNLNKQPAIFLIGK